MQIVEQRGRRYAMLTRIVRVPVDAIFAVRRSPSGAGAVVVTDRGANPVADDYDELVSALYGDGENVTH